MAVARKRPCPSVLAQVIAWSSRRSDHVRWKIAATARRYGRAWRYATGTLAQSDAIEVMADCYGAARQWPLYVIGADDILASAVNLYGQHPALPGLAVRAAARVHHRWEGTSEVESLAQDWALDLIREYADRDGIDLSTPSGR